MVKHFADTLETNRNWVGWAVFMKDVGYSSRSTFSTPQKSQTCFPYCAPKYKEFAMRTGGIESY
jgi:hypothetical protein